jgi:HPt (histidine-containing phosphotransfer) domain-containing protein
VTASFEERMAALRLRFRERARRDLDVLAEASANLDLEALRRTSHGLAGTAGIFGFGEIGEAAQHLEDALDAGEDDAALDRLCGVLVELLDRV